MSKRQLDIAMLNTLKQQMRDYWKNIGISILKWGNLDVIPRCESSDIEDILYQTGVAVLCKYQETLVIGKLASNFLPDFYGRPIAWSCILADGQLIGHLNETNSVLIWNRQDRKPTKYFVDPICERLGYIDRSIDINIMWQNLGNIIGCKSDEVLLSLKNVLSDSEKGIVASFVDPELLDGLRGNPVDVPFIADKLLDIYNAYKSRILEIFGVDYNAVDKKERVNTIEANANAELIPANRVTMLDKRREAIKRAKTVFNIELTCNKNPDIFNGGTENGTVDNNNTGIA